MKGFTAFFKKELTELERSKKLLICSLMFLFFGIMDPLMAKLTPKIMESFSDQYAEQGIYIGEIKVTAMDSWAQFVKNMPMALIAVIILFSGIFTSEYSKGTLIPLLTKGLSRTSAVAAKTAVMLLVWSGGMWLTFGVTYGYTAYYWDNSTVNNLFFAGLFWWLYGVFMLSLIVFFSSFANSGGQVILGVSGVYFVMLMTGMFSKEAAKYMPSKLTESSFLFNATPLHNYFGPEPNKYLDDLMEGYHYCYSFMITFAVSLVLILAAIHITKKRSL